MVTCAAAACRGGTTNSSAGPALLVVRERIEHVDGLALREPMLVEHPSGVLFTAGYSRTPEEFTDPPNLYRSDDGGVHWRPVDVGTVAQGALGNSDVDLAVGPDGTLYFLAMGFDRRVGEGTHIAVGVSHDGGTNWRWTFLARDRFDDRPWIGVTGQGVAHVIWNDGAGVAHAVSRDRGGTWSEGPRVYPRGGSSHLAVGPQGRIAVRVSPTSASGNTFDEGLDSLFVSVDDGVHWEVRGLPGIRTWQRGGSGPDGLPRWVEPVAWDRAGRLFSLWSEGTTLWLGRSADDGLTWQTWPLVQSSVDLYYPFLVPGPAGALAMTWFSGYGDTLRAHVALWEDPSAGTPVLQESQPLAVDAFRSEKDSLVRDPAGEYFPVAFLGDGDLGVILPIQQSPGGDGFVWVRLGR